MRENQKKARFKNDAYKNNLVVMEYKKTEPIAPHVREAMERTRRIMESGCPLQKDALDKTLNALIHGIEVKEAVQEFLDANSRSGKKGEIQ